MDKEDKRFQEELKKRRNESTTSSRCMNQG